MTITVGDLLEQLRDVDPETEVRFLAQPNWPFEYSIDKVIVVERTHEENTIEEVEEDKTDEAVRSEEQILVYLTEGNQLGYAPHDALEVAGWV